MEKIFYADIAKFSTTEDLAKKIFARYFGISNPKIQRTEVGKPYLLGDFGLFFSLSHTKDKVFFAVSDKNVGLDAESLNREVNYLPILQKFTDYERQTVTSTADFLKLWTLKESVIKWLGGTLASHLKNVEIREKQCYYKSVPLPVFLTEKEIDGHVLHVCSDKDFSNAELIPLSIL